MGGKKFFGILIIVLGYGVILVGWLNYIKATTTKIWMAYS
jgi:hypothetical protein